MEEKPKQWVLGIALGLALLVAYPLSYGPVLGIAARQQWVPLVFFDKYIYPIYDPVVWCRYHGPEPFRWIVNSYSELWLRY